MVLRWLADLNLGPVEKTEFDEWELNQGPWAPSTLSGVVAAIKNHSVECGAPWVLDANAKGALIGFRKRLRKRYGTARQATPLVGQDIYRIEQQLAEPQSKETSRDRLLIELHAVGVTLAAAGKLTRAAIREPEDGVRTCTSTANTALFVRTGEVGSTALAVRGQNRRGGKADPTVLLTLSDHPILAAALAAYLEHPDQIEQQPEDLLLGLSANSTDHARKILARTATAADIEWRPSRKTHSQREHSQQCATTSTTPPVGVH